MKAHYNNIYLLCRLCRRLASAVHRYAVVSFRLGTSTRLAFLLRLLTGTPVACVEYQSDHNYLDIFYDQTGKYCSHALARTYLYTVVYLRVLLVLAPISQVGQPFEPVRPRKFQSRKECTRYPQKTTDASSLL